MTDVLDPKQTPYEAIGGESQLHALVERFYDLMEIESKYAELRATHHENLDVTRHQLAERGGGPILIHKEIVRGRHTLDTA